MPAKGAARTALRSAQHGGCLLGLPFKSGAVVCRLPAPGEDETKHVARPPARKFECCVNCFKVTAMLRAAIRGEKHRCCRPLIRALARAIIKAAKLANADKQFPWDANEGVVLTDCVQSPS